MSISANSIHAGPDALRYKIGYNPRHFPVRCPGKNAPLVRFQRLQPSADVALVAVGNGNPARKPLFFVAAVMLFAVTIFRVPCLLGLSSGATQGEPDQPMFFNWANRSTGTLSSVAASLFHFQPFAEPQHGLFSLQRQPAYPTASPNTFSGQFANPFSALRRARKPNQRKVVDHGTPAGVHSKMRKSLSASIRSFETITCCGAGLCRSRVGLWSLRFRRNIRLAATCGKAGVSFCKLSIVIAVAI